MWLHPVCVSQSSVGAAAWTDRMFVSLVKLIKCTDYFYALVHFFFCLHYSNYEVTDTADAGQRSRRKRSVTWRHKKMSTVRWDILCHNRFHYVCCFFFFSVLIILFCKSFSVKFDRELCWKKKFFSVCFLNVVTVNRTFRAFLISSPSSTRGDSRGRRRLSKQWDYLWWHNQVPMWLDWEDEARPGSSINRCNF